MVETASSTQNEPAMDPVVPKTEPLPEGSISSAVSTPEAEGEILMQDVTQTQKRKGGRKPVRRMAALLYPSCGRCFLSYLEFPLSSVISHRPHPHPSLPPFYLFLRAIRGPALRLLLSFIISIDHPYRPVISLPAAARLYLSCTSPVFIASFISWTLIPPSPT